MTSKLASKLGTKNPAMLIANARRIASFQAVPGDNPRNGVALLIFP
jgi:hypothetical protein